MSVGNGIDSSIVFSSILLAFSPNLQGLVVNQLSPFPGPTHVDVTARMDDIAPPAPVPLPATGLLLAAGRRRT